jgi:heme exporter protein D
MIDDPHFGFILAAYLIAALVFVGLVSWIVTDYRLQTRTLEQLEASGVRRRSDSEVL